MRLTEYILYDGARISMSRTNTRTDEWIAVLKASASREMTENDYNTGEWLLFMDISHDYDQALDNALAYHDNPNNFIGWTRII